MPEVHARLSASASHRWLECPGSIKLGEQYESGTSIYAEEGTIAHAYAEALIGNSRPQILAAQGKAKKFYKAHPELEDTASHMGDTLAPYVEWVREEYNTALAEDAGAELLTEQRVEFDAYVPGGFGTSDVVIVRDGAIHIIDLKYGKGVPVYAEDNPQLKLYALGAIEMFDILYDIEDVTMTIYQPRLDNISTAKTTMGALIGWGANVVRPIAEEALGEDAHFSAGKWCQFCPARYTCEERAAEAMRIQAYMQKVTLSASDVADILGRIDMLTKFAEDIKAEALKEALDGKDIPGYKVVEGRSNRRYIAGKEADIVKACEKAGYEKTMLYTSPVLLTITNMEKLLGKKQFGEVLGEYIEKPEGKPTLAPVSDKRPAITNNSARDDFKDVED